MPEVLPQGFIPIAEDSFGNSFVMDVSLCNHNKNNVYFWEHEMEEEDATESLKNMVLLGTTFTEFLNKLVPYPLN